ncbi:MAG: hypothetical protein K6F97_10610 [Lachnospiraceae bacterium]|nr:hypothetical protein [Lachnospiraceae bacterium]
MNSIRKSIKKTERYQKAEMEVVKFKDDALMYCFQVASVIEGPPVVNDETKDPKDAL